MRLLLLFVIFPIIFAIANGHGDHGQAESTDHGAHSPHEKRIKDKQHFHEGEHNVDFDHEAVLGSRKEAEKFDSLSPEESKKRLRILAGKMDTNQDGFVDKSELTDWIERSLIQLDQEEVDERYDDIDENKDGFISWEEYKKEAFGPDDEEDAPDAEDLRLIDEDKRYFNAADRNGDNKLDKQEFAAFQNPEAHEHMFPALLAATLKDKDKDGDGKISLSEFLGENEKSEKEWVKVEKDRFNDDYDKNKDGVLDKEEMKNWLIPDLRETAEDEVKHLMSSANPANKDKLTIDEIVQHHDLFVGSEATNYGEHLEKLKHDEF